MLSSLTGAKIPFQMAFFNGFSVVANCLLRRLWRRHPNLTAEYAAPIASKPQLGQEGKVSSTTWHTLSFRTPRCLFGQGRILPS